MGIWGSIVFSDPVTWEFKAKKKIKKKNERVSVVILASSPDEICRFKLGANGKRMRKSKAHLQSYMKKKHIKGKHFIHLLAFSLVLLFQCFDKHIS